MHDQKLFLNHSGSANKPAGFTLRFLAMSLDSLIVWLPLTGYWLILTNSQSLPEFASNLSWYIVLVLLPSCVVWLWYIVPLVHFFQSTLGKMLTGLKITDEDGKPLTFKRNLFRHSIGYQFSGLLFGLGFLAIIKDSNKQGWHDHAVGSKVVVFQNTWPFALGALVLLTFIHFQIIATSVNQFANGPLKEQFPALIQSFVLQQKLDAMEKQNQDSELEDDTIPTESQDFDLQFKQEYQLDQNQPQFKSL